MKYLALCLAIGLPSVALAADGSRPTAWTERVQPQDRVARIEMPPVDSAALKAEDDRHLAETGLKDLRYAANLKVDLTPETAGTWERLAGGELLWRLRVYSKDALSLNFGFDQYFMPAGGRLFIYAADGKHVYRPFTADDNEDHGELWTPPVFGPETVLEVTIPEAARSALRLHLAYVNHDYRGFGRSNMEKSGACNIDVVCPIGDPFNDQDRANAVISTGGSRFCSGSLLNNTANDARPFFMSAAHCLSPGQAPSLVAFWNYYNSTCRPQGGGQSPDGDGSLSQFNTGAIFRGEFIPTDFYLAELDDPLSPAFNLYLAGWDRTPNPTQFDSPTGIHHPSTDEMRISFSLVPTIADRWSSDPLGSHVKVFWGPNLGVTEGGSSGSPIYTQQKRFIGQLHGGASFCGGPDLSDLYGRFSESWVGGGTDSTRVSNWLDPLGTGVIVLDGRNACSFPAAPGTVSATTPVDNTIEVTWDPVPGATYNVLRAVGSCPQTSYTPIATNVAATTYTDTPVSGGITYAYVVQSVVAGCPSQNSPCADATATGACTVPPTFGGATSVTATAGSCRLDVNWTGGTPGCPATTLTYNVYRSTDPAFVPSAANLLQACVSGQTYADTTVLPGTTYYYIVRAEDSTTGGTGTCNGGNEDGNLVRQSGNPDVVSVFGDALESGTANWVLDSPGPGNPWVVVTTQSHSPTHAWFTDDPAFVKDKRVVFAADVVVPAGATLDFWHRLNVETNAQCTPNTLCDGGVLEYSTDGGTSWFDILAGNGGSIPANPARFQAGAYTGRISSAFSNPLGGRMGWGGDNAGFTQVRVNLADFSGASVRFRWRFASDSQRADGGWWVDDVAIGLVQTCNAPAPVVVPLDLYILDGAGDSVLRPNEPAIMAPRWRNAGVSAVSLTGIASSFTGPAGPTYDIPDATASYGTIPAGGENVCVAANDCYSVSVTASSRPATHWDGTILETVNPAAATKTWTLHIGDSFTDVPEANGFYRFIETILHNGVTVGCTTSEYCPTASTTREAMAAFVLVANDPTAAPPPSCVAGAETFDDVPASSPFCRWIEELFRRGVVTGCGTDLYCPTSAATREQMAVFVLRTLDPALDPPACVAGSEAFDDVPASSGFCRWIEELARRGVVTGCSATSYCPGADVTREQMSVFLAVTFGLVLYGL